MRMFEIIECTAADIRAVFESGALTSEQLVGEYLRRISRYDRQGPALHAIIELNPDALFIAQAMDRERAQGRVRSPLHGVPVVLKDNINTHDKMCTGAGSLALADNFAPYDAHITARLRQAGLVILGKANMTEFANYLSYNMKNGYSSRGGQTVNPYHPDGDTSGSSSGSAVAVAANLCALAVGTETNGSIIWPACHNGVVGLKPTRGLVSRHGIIPISTTQDIAGPLTRTVADAAALLSVLVGEDERDPSTWGHGAHIPPDYTAFLDDGLRGLTLGCNRAGWDKLSAAQRDIAGRAFESLGHAGATLVHDANLPQCKCDRAVLFHEFKGALESYLATNPSLRCRTLADIISFLAARPGEGLRYGMNVFLDVEHSSSGTLTEPAYIDALFESRRLTRDDGLDRVMDEHRLDILVTPGTDYMAPISGYPSINVPAGYDECGLPFGITMIARPYGEPALIAAAHAFEQATKARKPPTLD